MQAGEGGLPSPGGSLRGRRARPIHRRRVGRRPVLRRGRRRARPRRPKAMPQIGSFRGRLRRISGCSAVEDQSRCGSGLCGTSACFADSAPAPRRELGRRHFGTAEIVGLAADARSVVVWPWRSSPLCRNGSGRRVFSLAPWWWVFFPPARIACREVVFKRSILSTGHILSRTRSLAESQLARLRPCGIEGQCAVLLGMIEEDRYCIDVITQVRAVRAPDKVEQETPADLYPDGGVTDTGETRRRRLDRQPLETRPTWGR